MYYLLLIQDGIGVPRVSMNYHAVSASRRPPVPHFIANVLALTRKLE